MIRRIARLTVALAVPLTLVAVPTVAHAGVCVEKDTFNYSPPLGLTATSGSMTGTHDNTPCVFSTPSSGSIGASYTGNCIVAIFGANTASVVVLGGTVHVMVDAAATKAKVIVPMFTDGYCPTSTATGTGVWVDNT